MPAINLNHKAMKKIVFLSVALLLGFLVQVSGQDRLVKGKIKCSADSTPVFMVSVVLKGTTIGTASGENGDFLLKIPARYGAVDTLSISCIGMQSQEIEIPGDSPEDFSIYLVEDNINLSEVTIVYDTTTGQSWTYLASYSRDSVLHLLVHIIDSLQSTDRLRNLR